MAKATTKEVAAELAKAVRFGSESVVVVRFRVAGAATPKLEHKVKAKERAVEFSQPMPKGFGGLALLVGVEYFAVTKGAKVSYVGVR